MMKKTSVKKTRLKKKDYINELFNVLSILNGTGEHLATIEINPKNKQALHSALSRLLRGRDELDDLIGKVKSTKAKVFKEKFEKE